MSALVKWAAQNTLLALLLTFGLCLGGLYAFQRLPIDAVPDVTNIQVQVVTRAPSLSATEVESQITQPVERAMAGTPGLVQTRSISKLGISIVTLIFTDDEDVYFARAQVSERLSGVRDDIPAEIGRPELGPVTTALGEIFMFELKPDDPKSRTLEELRTIVEWQISPKLRQVPGVVEVVGFGGAIKQYRVTLDPPRLAAHQVSVEDVKLALERDNQVTGGGYIERAGEQIVLRGDARFRGIEDIAATVIRTDDRGVPIRISEVGEVDTGPALRQGAMTRDGRGEVVGASVMMLKGQNSREVVTRVKAAIEEFTPYLPAGVRIDPYYDRAEFINQVLKTVAKNLSEGALIVVLCLLLTLGSIRAGLIVAGAIPFAMLIGFIGLVVTGQSGNVMSLGAVDFGIVVEGAVLVVEHAMTHGALEEDRRKRARALRHAMQEVARPAVFGVVITLLVFLPLVSLEDVEGKMFRPVVISLCFMLLGALFYALVLVPAIAPKLLIDSVSKKEPWLVRMVRKGYEPAVDWTLARPKRTLAACLVITGVLLGIGSSIGAEFLPRMFEGSFAIDATRPPSTSLTQAIDLAKEAEVALKESPEVLTVVNRIGRPEGAVDPAGPESSDVFVILKPRSEWRHGLTPEALADELSDRVDKRVPATLSAFSQPIEMRVNDLIAGVKSDIAIKIYGDDLATMSEVGERIRRAILQVPGAADVKLEIATGLPSVRVRVDRDRAARLGIGAHAVLNALQMSRAGLPVSKVREGERVFDLVLRLGGEQVKNEADLARLPIATQRGSIVPLSVVSDVVSERTVVQVSREQMRRRLTVQVNVRGRDVIGFVKEAQAKVNALETPKSVELVWGGQFQNFNRAKARLSLLVPISIGVIALLLVISFRNVKYMMVTVLSLPFALSGGLLGLVVRGLPFSIPAAVGFIATAGVAVMTGIVLTTSVQAHMHIKDPVEQLRLSAKASLRAPLSTALVAAVGFIPASIATGTGSEVQRPLATVVIFGLIVGMVLSLIALPCMLLLVRRWEVLHPPKPDDEEPIHSISPPAPNSH